MRRYFFDYVFDVSDDLGIPFKTINTDDFDIVPKKDYLKRRVKDKEEELRRTESARNNTMRYYDSIMEGIRREIEELKGKT